jgi:hypothetical protein
MPHSLLRKASTHVGVVALAVVTGWMSSALAQTAIQSQDSNISGVVAEITECKRADGVLTIRMRLRNTGTEKADVQLVRYRAFQGFYLTANNKKYFILQDSEKTPLAPSVDNAGNVSAQIPKGGSYTWWAKYPAPPPDVKKVSYYTPITGPFDNIPITD